MGDFQSPSATVLPAESDDIGVIQETVVQDSSAGDVNTHSSVLFHHLGSLITSVSKTYDIERIQVGLGLLLVFLLGICCLCIAVAWKYYSPVIIDFTTREQQERLRRNCAKEKQEKETKVD